MAPEMGFINSFQNMQQANDFEKRVPRRLYGGSNGLGGSHEQYPQPAWGNYPARIGICSVEKRGERGNANKRHLPAPCKSANDERKHA